MEALTSLGINGKMLIAQIINFLVLLFILNKLLYKPILKMFDERRLKIEQGLKDAEKAKETRQSADDEAEKIREKAYKEANDIIAGAKKEATMQASEIKTDATREAEKMLKNAGEEAMHLKKAALNDAKSELSEIISLSLSRIVTNKLDQNTRQKLTAEAIEDIK